MLVRITGSRIPDSHCVDDQGAHGFDRRHYRLRSAAWARHPHERKSPTQWLGFERKNHHFGVMRRRLGVGSVGLGLSGLVSGVNTCSGFPDPSHGALPNAAVCASSLDSYLSGRSLSLHFRRHFPSASWTILYPLGIEHPSLVIAKKQQKTPACWPGLFCSIPFTRRDLRMVGNFAHSLTIVKRSIRSAVHAPRSR